MEKNLRSKITPIGLKIPDDCLVKLFDNVLFVSVHL